MPSETTYWIIVVAALLGALALWLLTRETPKPKKRVTRKPSTPARVEQAAVPIEQAPAEPAILVAQIDGLADQIAVAPEADGTEAPDAPAEAAEDATEAEAATPIGGKMRGRPRAPRADAIPGGQADALTTLKGLGPRAAARLNELGVSRFDQIAAWTEEDVARIDPQMGSFRGRIVRDRWIEQATYLAGGDRAGFEAKFGRLGNV